MNRACTGFDLPDRRMISAVPQPSAVARMMAARHVFLRRAAVGRELERLTAELTTAVIGEASRKAAA
jgi:hypothetical protein